MNRLQCIRNLRHVAPEYLLGDVGVVLASLETVSSAQMLFGEGLGLWVVVRDKDEGAILEAAAGKRIVDGYHTSIANALPRLDGPNGLFIGQTET